MTRLAGMLFLGVAAVAARFLFNIKLGVQELETELRAANGRILQHQEAIRVLETEWSYFNRPDRIAELAARHLGLRPMGSNQIVSLDALPRRTDITPASAGGGGQ